MNIFNWAQDHNITWIDNIAWWLMNNASWVYQIIRPNNGLTKKRAEKICRIMFNQICINAIENLVRVIGCGDDGEDFYYITKDQQGKIVWETMVGYMIPLKGKISNADYYRVEKGFSGWVEGLGNCPPEKEFLSAYEPTDFAIRHYGAPATKE